MISTQFDHLAALMIPVYTTDVEGNITFYNEAAATFWGVRPEIGISKWCGSWRLSLPDGTPLAHRDSAMAMTLQNGAPVIGSEAVAERPDGTQVAFLSYPSLVLNEAGDVTGAVNLLVDITERKRGEDLCRLLFNELNHRVKNTLAIIQSIASQSLRSSPTPAEFVLGFNGRVQALARAHDLLVKTGMKDASIADLVNEQVILEQFHHNIIYSGPDVRLDAATTVQMALVLHELASNARRHGALALLAGSLTINWRVETGAVDKLILDWQEGGLTGLRASDTAGFGLTLIGQALDGRGGTTELVFLPGGVWCHITLPLNDIEQRKLASAALTGATQPSPGAVTPEDSGLGGRKILVIEDDALIAMDICGVLADEGMVVIGPARNLEQAREIAEAGGFEMALVDANLNGKPVHEVVDQLARSEVPFAFCTGYGRAALPPGYDDRPVLAKPFGRNDLVAVVKGLQADASVQA